MKGGSRGEVDPEVPNTCGIFLAGCLEALGFEEGDDFVDHLGAYGIWIGGVGGRLLDEATKGTELDHIPFDLG